MVLRVRVSTPEVGGQSEAHNHYDRGRMISHSALPNGEVSYKDVKDTQRCWSL